MTEDRLTHLLTEATDLTPSATLRARVADLRPRKETPWFALSGASAALAVAALLAMPREVSAAELLKRANDALRLNVAYRLEVERQIDGKWRKSDTFFHEQDRTLSTQPDGSFTFRTQRNLYLKFVPGGPILRTRNSVILPFSKNMVDDPRPSAYARFFPLRATRGTASRSLPMTAGDPREEDGRMVRDVVVFAEPGFRLRYVIDTDTGLPLRMESEARKDDVWRGKTRSRYTYLGAARGDETFDAALRSAPIVDADALCRRWEARLSRILRTIRSDDGKVLQIRDLRTLPDGDVLILYTGTPHVGASLEGPHGEPFAPCWFQPNLALFGDAAVPPLRPSGKRLCGLWFVPLHRDRPVCGPLRLRLWSPPLGNPNRAYRATADVQLDAPLQAASFPPYRNVLTARPFDTAKDLYRSSARINALAGHWLDLKGHSLPGPILGNVDAYPDLTSPFLRSPVDAKRHDPRAAAEAARLLRAYLTRSHDHWVYLDQERAAPILATLDEWAKGS